MWIAVDWVQNLNTSNEYSLEKAYENSYEEYKNLFELIPANEVFRIYCSEITVLIKKPRYIFNNT